MRTHAGAAFSTSFPAFYSPEQGCVLTSVQLQKMAGIQLCRAHAEPGLLDSPLLWELYSCCALFRDVSLGDGGMSARYQVLQPCQCKGWVIAVRARNFALARARFGGQSPGPGAQWSLPPYGDRLGPCSQTWLSLSMGPSCYIACNWAKHEALWRPSVSIFNPSFPGELLTLGVLSSMAEIRGCIWGVFVLVVC